MTESVIKKYAGLLLVSACFIFVGCSSGSSKVGGVLGLDTNLKLTVNAASDINPDEKDKPSPLFIRLYELKSPQLFEKADFIAMYERDEEVLGADFIAKQELTRFVPGTERTESLVLSKETRYVGLYAEFFDYGNSQYKIVFPVTANNVFRNKVEVRVSGNKLVLVE